MPFQTTIPLDWGQKKQEEFSITRQNSRCTADGTLAEHWHDCFEIILMLDGNRDFTAGERSFLLEKDDLLIIPPHLSHSSTGGIYQSIVFGYAESVIYTPDNSFTGMKYLLPFRDAETKLLQGNSSEIRRLRQLILRGMELFSGDSPVRTLEIQACILQMHAILWQIYLGNAQKTEKAFRYLSEAQEYIEAHLTEDISPYEIADALHISHSHLCRIIRTALHMTPAALINQYRLCLAERLLTDRPDMSISDVAACAGFGDESYFIRCFKTDKGVTPGNFRKAVSKKQGAAL